jgi:hypothetical protein
MPFMPKGSSNMSILRVSSHANQEQFYTAAFIHANPTIFITAVILAQLFCLREPSTYRHVMQGTQPLPVVPESSEAHESGNEFPGPVSHTQGQGMCHALR